MSRPLDWPSGLRRTLPVHRRRSGEWRHYIQIRDAIIQEIYRRGGDNAFLSTDAPDGAEGTPVGQRRSAWDPGVVVYFQIGTHWYAHACDLFTDRIGNMGRIADRLGYGARPMRLRWPTRLHGRKRPRPGDYGRRRADERPASRWWRDLGLTRAPSSLDEAESAFRTQVKKHHPDRGGDTEKMRRAVEAVEHARATMV